MTVTMTDETATDEFVDVALEGDDALDALRAENAQLRDQALRYAAEAENVRRRAEKESNDARAFAIQRFARDLFGVADNLERALQFAPRGSGDAAVNTFVQGVELTEKDLTQAFERNGLKRLDPQRGERFDPHLHQAMTEQPAEGVAAGAVVQTMQAGWELFGRTLRPAMVVVAAKTAATAPPEAPGAYAAGTPDEAGQTYDTKA